MVGHVLIWLLRKCKKRKPNMFFPWGSMTVLLKKTNEKQKKKKKRLKFLFIYFCLNSLTWFFYNLLRKC